MSPRSLLADVAARRGPRALHDALTPDQRQALRFCWPAHARRGPRTGSGEHTGQLAPDGDWTTWLVLAGRGFGKTRVGAEWAREKATRHPGCRIALIGATADETRKVMYRGPSGLENVCPPWDQPHFNVTDQCLEWRNGSRAYLYTAEKPGIFRGPQHHFAWCDELAKWRRLKDAWDNLTMGLRLGDRPQMLVTTTPLPLKLLIDLRKRPSTVVTVGSTFDNSANLPPSFLTDMRDRYAGTTLGRQELNGELFAETPGSLWRRDWLDVSRVSKPANSNDAWTPVAMRRVIVGVDPATTSHEESDETGIVVAGLGEDGRCYVLEDASIKASPDQWARRAVEAYRHWNADRVVAETTQGGELVSSCIRLVDSTIPITEKGGNRGKHARAEPVAALYEQGRVSHVGYFEALENQLCTYTLDAKKSPDHMDALVYAVSELMLGETQPTFVLM